MKVICENGNAMPVDDSNVDYEASVIPGVSIVAMVVESIHLKPVWIATVERDKNKFQSFRKPELEFVNKKIFDHDPSENELIYFMAENGIGFDGYVRVEKAYKMDQHQD